MRVETHFGCCANFSLNILGVVLVSILLSSHL